MILTWKKPICVLLCVLFCLCLVQRDIFTAEINTFSVLEEGMLSDKESVFILPTSVQIIEEDAFNGTAAVCVYAQEGLKQIEDGAFSNVISLTEVYLPESLSYISESAFYGVEALTVYGSFGSIAERWAEEQGFRFEAQSIGTAASTLIQTLLKLQCVFFLFSICRQDLTKRKRIEDCTDNGILCDPKERMGFPVLELIFP